MNAKSNNSINELTTVQRKRIERKFEIQNRIKSGLILYFLSGNLGEEIY
jgi:hypothetical protein